MSISQLHDRVTFGFSAENPTGEKSGGTRGKDCEKLHSCIAIKPGETATICDAHGPGMLTHLWFGGYVGHSFILRIYWDDCPAPSVEAPLSAFFGLAYDENYGDRDDNWPVLNSAMLLVAPGRGMNSYFEMPFRKRCRITIENRGKQAEACYYMLSGWYGEIPENSGYFHAAYRQEHPVQKGRSYTVIDGIRGSGRFAGLTLAVGVNGTSTCWLEGEAKMYIDGDRYPTMNYTGTEDYFCGSYGFGNDIYLEKYQTFSGLYTGMFAILGNPARRYENQQRFLLYRFHAPDPIYFREDFAMKLDNQGWTGPRYDDLTSVAYWYLKDPAPVPTELPAEADLVMS